MHHPKPPGRVAALCAALAMTVLLAGAQFALAVHYARDAHARLATRQASAPLARAAHPASGPRQPG